MKPLTDPERQLAVAAARCIATAEEIGLPDRPEKIVTSPAAIRVLARAYLELHEQVLTLHGVVDKTDPTNPVAVALGKGALAVKPPRADLHEKLWQKIDDLGLTVRAWNALTWAGIEYVGELVQLSGRALLRLKNLGKWSLKDIEGQLAENGLVLGNDLADWPGPRWICSEDRPYVRKLDPQIVTSPEPTAPAPAANPLVALYCRVMGDVEATFTSHDRFVVRQWDGMDGCWTDCTGEVDRDEALRVWAERTNGGTRQVAYAEIDYYRIFPGDTRMKWDGSEGREMHR